MGYTLSINPSGIRSTGVGEFEQLSGYCADVYIEPPFNPGEGLKKALGVSDKTIFEHVSTTYSCTHLYVEVPCGRSTNAERIAEIFDRLEEYLNPTENRSAQDTVDKFREDII